MGNDDTNCRIISMALIQTERRDDSTELTNKEENEKKKQI